MISRSRFSIALTILGALLAFVTLGSIVARAQNVGSVQGTVVDPSGAGVTGVVVKLTDAVNSTTRTMTTDADGSFNFAQVNPGNYRLEVSKDGFRTHVEEHVAVLVATPTRVDVRLELGSVSQQVTVEGAEAPALNTQDATVGNTVDEKSVSSLPFLARNVVNLLTLQPGVVFTGMSNTDRLSQGSIGTLDAREGSVDGVRGNQTNVTLDGVDSNDWQNQAAFTSALPVTLDSVQEVRVTTTNANATSGVVGGPQVELVTKSGTDQFHGNVRWYYRTSGTAANDFFNNLNGIPLGKDQRNIAGGSLAGPVWKDRIFFFLDNEERREAVSAAIGPRSVPSDALKAGVLVYDCTGSVGCPTAPTTVVGQNGTVTVPAGAFGLSPAQFQAADPAHLGINPAMLAYLNLFPSGNNPAASFDGGFAFNALSFNTVEGTANNIYTGRLDFLLTKNGHHSIFVRGELEGLKTDLLGGQFPGLPSNSQLLNNSRGIAVNYQAQLRPSIVNTLRYGLTRIGVAQSGTSGASFDVRSFTDVQDFGARPLSRVVPVHEVNDDLSWTRGRHTFQFGGSIYVVRNTNINETNSFPAFDVNNGFCINLCSDFNLSAVPAPADPTSFVRAFTALTGSITQVNATVFATPQGQFLPAGSPEVRHFAENLFEGYFQDSWKLRRNLNVTLGLHYSYETPPWETNGFEVAPTTDIMQWFTQREIGMNAGVPSDASPLLSWTLAGKANHGANSWFDPDYKNFAPRAAIAYSPNFGNGLLNALFGQDKSVIRLGAGLFYDRIGQAIALDSDQNGSPGTATALIDGSQQFSLATAPRFSGTCAINGGCTGLPTAGAPFFNVPTAATFPFTPAADTSNLGFAVDPHLKTPYTIHLTASFQRQFSKGVVLDVAYVGTLGRRLLGKADFAQYLDIRDPKSGITLFDAFRQTAALAQATPTGPAAINPKNIAALQAIPSNAFFTDMLPNMPTFAADFFGNPAYASLTPTQAFYAFTTRAAGVGGGAASWSCALFALDTNSGPGGLPTPWNSTVDPQGDGFVLFQPQFSQIGAWTNWANSNYNSLQVTVKKNVGFGTFAFNYVFSKSIDNDSTAENGDFAAGNNGTVTGLIQNPFDVGLNRGLSDFDLRHNFNGFAVIDLPFGAGHHWLSSNNRLVNAIVGGWEVTSAARWRSGFPQSPGNGFNFPTNFFLTSAGTLLSPLQSGINRNAPAANNDGTFPGPNLFKNPSAALADIGFTLPGLPGSRNVLSGPGYASLDMGLHKGFQLWNERSKLQFRVTVFNVFNSVNFADNISLDPTSPATFGQITSTANGFAGNAVNREMEFAIRLEF